MSEFASEAERKAHEDAQRLETFLRDLRTLCATLEPQDCLYTPAVALQVATRDRMNACYGEYSRLWRERRGFPPHSS